ncbi:MAG: HAD family phosphatase [Paracoccaceae bacterium]
MYDAFLFDLDGTLIDTESIALRTNLAVFHALGHPVDEAFLHGLIGKDAPTSAALIRDRLPGIDLALLERELTAAFYRGVDQGLSLKPGVAELLPRLDAPAVVVTSSSRAGALRKLQAAGLASAFADVIALEDVSAAKPAPDPYLLAAERLGVAPARCLVFEDSEIGAEAAHRAGCRVVQVPDILPTEGRFAHHVAPTLIEGARMAGLPV